MAGKGVTMMKMGEIRQKVKIEQLEWHDETWVEAATWDEAGCGGAGAG